jgi:hypothetical protein
MKSLNLQITEELFAAVETARGEQPRNPWIESTLWRAKAVRDAADAAGIAKPARPAEGRGKYRRRNGRRRKPRREQKITDTDSAGA